MQRIARRARPGEEHIDTAYLKRVTDAYARFFYDYDGAPLLIVNATEIDLASSDEDYLMLLEQIRSVNRGRHYFNPIPSML